MQSSNSVTKAISQRLSRRRLFYVCRDLERAVGIDLTLPGYYIITNYNEYSAKLALQYPHIILIKEKEQLNTNNLLRHKNNKKMIKKNDYVLVFKSNALIETECKKNGWKLLNPNAKLADKIEGKISQIYWLGKLAKYLPPHRVDVCANIKWDGRPFILQFSHAHTGSGTMFISSKKQLSELATKFPLREARITKFINGPVFTNNNVVWGNKILIGNINYQITGLSPFTDNKFATIGNDWVLPGKVLSAKQIKQYKQIVNDIGKKLSKDGWKGLYGVDIIADEKTRRVYLLEINARQPASATFESRLQTSDFKLRTTDITTFEAHIASLLDLPNKGYKLISINNGAQIIQRVTNKKIMISKINDDALVNIIKYNNTSPGSDLIRYQFSRGLMKKHNILNELGKKICP